MLLFGRAFRYTDSFDDVNNLEVIVTKGGKEPSTGGDFLNSISYLFGETTKLNLETKSEGKTTAKCGAYSLPSPGAAQCLSLFFSLRR